jgi:outer membrane protein TolC
MMRWKQVIVGLAVTLAAISGCKQQCFLHECDYDHYHDIGLPTSVECDPSKWIQPVTSTIPVPNTALDPDRPPRYLSLAEAIAMALEHGRVGSANITSLSLGVIPGPGSNLLLSASPFGFTQPLNGLSDSIRVLRLDPARFGPDIELALSKFDAQWQTSMFWNNTDNPVNGTFLNNFQPNGESARLVSSVLKPLPTGGVAGITFDTNYRLLSTPQGGVPNPAYTTDLQFQFEQPLLRGYGIEINQLLPAHPGNTTNPFALASLFANPTASEGILVTRVRFDQERANFENSVHIMLVAVKQAYWNLYGSYWTLYAQEQALRQAYEAWKINKARFEAGRIGVMDFAQTRQQYELFRSNRLTALGQILENERTLRELLGLPVEDCTRLIPIDEPTLTPYCPDWCTALNECMALRPPLVVQREELKAKLFDVMVQKNSLLPDLRAFATYQLSGLGDRLDGPNATNASGEDINALRNMATGDFINWSLGLRMNVPIGFRAQHAALRRSRLALTQQYMLLHDYEERAQHFLAQEYRALFEAHAQIEINRSQRVAAAEQLESRFRQYLAGQGTLDILLESQRVWASALQSEYQSIVLYNNALVAFEFAKGTIAQDESVTIAEGPLPCCAAERAVDHLKEKTKAIVLRQRAAPPTCATGSDNGVVPQIPDKTAPAVSTLPFMQRTPPASGDLEKLPEAKPMETETMPAPKSSQSEKQRTSSPTEGAAPSAGLSNVSTPSDMTGMHPETKLDATEILGIAPLPVESIRTTVPGVSGSPAVPAPSLDKALRTLPPIAPSAPAQN